jgi:type II secretory pathway component PulF
MALYYYKAYTVDQKIIKGATFCAHSKDLYTILKNQNLKLIKGRRPVIVNFFSMVTLKDLKDWAYFSRILLRNNVSLTEVLSLTAEQTMNCKLKEALYHTLYDVEHGFSLSKAIKKHEKIFTHITVLTLGMAEKTGNLVSAFDNLYNYFDHQLMIKNKISSAIRYPLFVFLFLILMIVGLNTIFVPELMDFFQSADHVPDSLNLWFSIFDNIYILVLFIFSIFLTFSIGSKVAHNTDFFDKILLNLPFVKIIYDLQIANFLSCLSLLLESGTDLKEASKTSIQNMKQSVIKKSLHNIEPLLQNGHSLSFALMSVLYIDNVTIRFLKMGEKAGEQSKHLVMCSQTLFDRSYYKINQLTNTLQPLCLLLIGGLLLWVATTLITPLYTQFSGVLNG